MKLSVSQYNQYKRCPYSFKLARIDKAWQRPAAWLPQGSAVHSVIEAIEKSERTMSLGQAQEVFREEYAKEVEKYTEVTPNFEYWSRSGPYAGEADIERRYHLGLEQVGRYFDWMAKYPHIRPWRTPDGTLAIEIGFEVELGEVKDAWCAGRDKHYEDCDCADGVTVRGFIDAIMQNTDTGEIFVDDAKTGNQPGDDFQLATYKVAVEKQFGLEGIRYGVYWMGRTGSFTKPYDLTGWTVDRVAEEFDALGKAVAAGEFEPDPEPSKCMFCDVSNACAFRQ